MNRDATRRISPSLLGATLFMLAPLAATVRLTTYFREEQGGL